METSALVTAEITMALNTTRVPWFLPATAFIRFNHPSREIIIGVFFGIQLSY